MSLSDRVIAGITKLNGENYHDWKFAVSMLLRAQDSWDIVLGIEPRPKDVKDAADWDRKAQDGLMVIGLTMELSQYTYIRDSPDGPKAWKALKDAYEKNSRATCISLKQQFYGFEHKAEEPMQKYVNGILELAGKLKAIRVTLLDKEITDVLIFNLDQDFSNIASMLTASREELKISDVTGALLEEEGRRGGPPDNPIDIATSLYTSQRPGMRRGPHQDHQEGLAGNRNCYHCYWPGHFARECHATTYVNSKKILPDDLEQKEERAAYSYYVQQTLNNVAYWRRNYFWRTYWICVDAVCPHIGCADAVCLQLLTGGISCADA